MDEIIQESNLAIKNAIFCQQVLLRDAQKTLLKILKNEYQDSMPYREHTMHLIKSMGISNSSVNGIC